MRNVKSAVAVAAAFAVGSASAVNLDPGGSGQALVYSYYTVNNGQDTYLTISNPFEGYQGTVVKVRFLEGRRGRPVLDFSLFLRGHDVWTGVISQVSDEGGAKLVTSDTSCTRPAIPAGGIEFTSSGYDGSDPDIPADDDLQDISRTREGFVEVIAGGTVAANSYPPPPPPPVDCATIFDSLQGQLVSPVDITGSAAIIDVANGHYYAYNADALAHFTSVPLYSSDWGPLSPSLEDANTYGSDHAVAQIYADGVGASAGDGPIAASFALPIDAVSAVMMADTIANEYLIDPGLGANTDWVMTLPTRRFYTDPIYRSYGDGNTWGSTLFISHEAAVFDREAHSAIPEDGDDGVRLDHSTNVLSFRPATPEPTLSGVFASHLGVNVAPDAPAGMMRLDIGGHRRTASGNDFRYLRFGQDEGTALFGIPLVGFAAYNIVNANAQPGRLANYGAVSPFHRTACVTSVSFDMGICPR